MLIVGLRGRNVEINVVRDIEGLNRIRFLALLVVILS